jgi:uncharacterized RDD family membrane protein YckC
MSASIDGGLALAVSLAILGGVWILRRLGRLPDNPRFAAIAPGRHSQLEGCRLAGFGKRAAAWLIDFTLIAVVALVFGLALAIQKSTDTVNVHFDPFDPAHGILDVVLLVAYFGLMTYFGRGQTPGKRLMKIRVVSLTHEHLSLWHSVERALGYAASALEAGFGFWQYFVHPNHQTVHDRIAETIVIDASPDPGRAERR